MASITGNPKAGASRRWSIPLLILGFWTLVGLMYASQHYLGFESISWWRLAVWQLLVNYVWAMLTPLILWWGRRFRLERPHLIRGLAAHLFLGSITSIIRIGAYTYLTGALKVYQDWHIVGLTNQFVHFIWMYFSLDFFTYCAILGVGMAFDYHRMTDRLCPRVGALKIATASFWPTPAPG